MRNHNYFWLILLALFVNVTPLCAEVVDQIVAEVNGEIITYSELKRILDPIYAQYSKVYGGEDLISRVRMARTEALNQLIENKLVLQEAKAQGLEMNEDAVSERLKEIKARFPNEEAFLETLKKEGTSYDSFVSQVKDQLLIKALVGREVTSRVIVSPKEVKEFYDLNKEKFSEGEKVHLFHIMVRKDPQNLFLSEETARQLLKKVKDGEDFEQLAKNYSEGPNADKGGDLGFVQPGQLIPQLGDVAFKLSIGQTSDLIDLQGAYHILWVKEKTKPELKSLDQVERQVEDAVFRQKATEMNQKWISSLREKAFISVFE